MGAGGGREYVYIYIYCIKKIKMLCSDESDFFIVMGL